MKLFIDGIIIQHEITVDHTPAKKGINMIELK
jgi:hypothetical protein